MYQTRPRVTGAANPWISLYKCWLERFLIVVARRRRAAVRWTDWDRQDKCLARGSHRRRQRLHGGGTSDEEGKPGGLPSHEDSASTHGVWPLKASHDTWGCQFTNVPFGLSFHAQTCSV